MEYSAVGMDVTAGEIAEVISYQDNGGSLRSDSNYPSIKVAVSTELHKFFPANVGVSEKELLEYWVKVFPKCAVAMDGAEEALAHLHAKGYYLGIISNGARITRIATARNLKSSRYLSLIVSSEEVAVSKPSTKIFKMVIESAGFLPEQCIYIGDNPVNDIEGAQKAGMLPIWLSGFHDWPASLDPPYYSINTLNDLVPLISSL